MTVSDADFFAGLRSPADRETTPRFASGWFTGDAEPAPFLRHLEFTGASWSQDLEEFHEESSRDHFIDVLTRQTLIEAVADSVRANPTGPVADLGCSTGYLLEDLAAALPNRQLVGVDVIASGLEKAHALVPDAALFLADVCDLPFDDRSVQAVVSANMLEHVAQDVQALREIRRVLVPGGVAALIVPYGRRLYDYYDRYLGHERRYGPGELADKASQAGLTVLRTEHLGQLLSPAFWAVKKRNRLLRDGLTGAALQAQVARDISGTKDSALGAAVCRLERSLVRRGASLPFGIRELLVVRRLSVDSAP